MTATRRSLLKASALVLYLGPAQLARGATILAVRVWPANDYTRVTIESDVPLQTQVQFIEEPPRLAVDIQGLVLDESLRNLVRQVRPDDPYIAGIRAGGGGGEEAVGGGIEVGPVLEGGIAGADERPVRGGHGVNWCLALISGWLRGVAVQRFRGCGGW